MELLVTPKPLRDGDEKLSSKHPLEDCLVRLTKLSFSIIHEPASSPSLLGVKSIHTTPSPSDAADIGRFSVELGIASMNLVDIHLGSPLSRKLASHFLPKPEIIGRSATGSKSHYLYRTGNAPGPSSNFALPNGLFAEYKTAGSFELFPPSTNRRTQMPIEISASGWPLFHHEHQLITQLSWMAVCATLYPFFKDGDDGARSELITWGCGALAGLFATTDEIEKVARTLCKVCNDDYSKNRREAFIRAIVGLGEDDDAKGRLTALIGLEAVNAILRNAPQRPPRPIIQF